MRIALLQEPTIKLNLSACGGLEWTELEELTELQKRGHHVSLTVSSLKGINSLIDVIPYKSILTHLDYRLQTLIQFIYYFKFFCRHAKADIFHGHFAMLLPLIFPPKSILHFQGITGRELIGYKYFKKRYHLSHYIFCSKFIKEYFKKMYPKIPNDHLHVIYNGVDSAVFTPPSVPRSAASKNIIFYGGWISEKGIYDLLEMAQILNNKGVSFKLVVGGSAYGHYAGFGYGEPAEIDKKVKEMASDIPNIEFPGVILHEELPELLKQMDIGIVPSTYEDPFPLVPLEMMGAGLPVIAYDIGGVRECLINGITGLLVPNKRPDLLAVAMEELLNDGVRRKKMGENARVHVEKQFTWKQHCDQLETVYEEIVCGK